MKKLISFFALAAIVGFISCDSVGPASQFLQDPVYIGPIDLQEGPDPWMDPDSSESCPGPWWIGPDSCENCPGPWWMGPDSCENCPGPWWMGPDSCEICPDPWWMDPDSSEMDPYPEPDSSNVGGS